MITQEILDAYERKDYNLIWKSWNIDVNKLNLKNPSAQAFFVKTIILNDDDAKYARLYFYMKQNSSPVLWKDLRTKPSLIVIFSNLLDSGETSASIVSCIRKSIKLTEARLSVYCSHRRSRELLLEQQNKDDRNNKRK